MLIEELEKLKTEKEGETLFERIRMDLNALLPQMRQSIAEELKSDLIDEIGRQITAIKVKDGRDGRDGKDADPEKAAKIVLERMPKPKDGKDGRDAPTLEEILAKIPKPLKKGGGGDTIIADDLSDQCDGSTRSFITTKKIGKPVLVVSSQFPNVLRLTTDFSASGTTLTIDSSLPPIQSGQTLYFIYAEG